MSDNNDSENFLIEKPTTQQTTDADFKNMIDNITKDKINASDEV